MLYFRDIFPEQKPVFIAEIGLNHNGDFNTACKMITEAEKSGASAVKFQTFNPEYMNSVYTSSLINDGKEKEPSNNERDFFRQFILTKNEYKKLKTLSSGLNIEFFSSPFDSESVDLLEETGTRIYKIASSEVTNHLLLKKIATTGKPVIMSTGISTLNEIAMAVDLLKENGTPDIILMHCVSLYPTPPEAMNLKRINTLKDNFNLETGFSDHSSGTKSCEAAAAMGVRFFEKHFKPDKDFDCPDKDVSLSPEEFKVLIDSVSYINTIKGSGEINISAEKNIAKLARRSLFAKTDIPEGKALTEDDIIPKRPGIGIPVYELKELLGKKTNREIKKDFLIRKEYFLI
ncbi:MAG: N-acetylneuraminate synthase family protein [Spirochaetes bacterium]|nr:N-acetylneuraminate synthase family protein [Spirochaetota bacterium]